MNRIHLATGLARDAEGRVLLVASRYANHAEPLWTLPGGRQEPGELLDRTVVREVFEETGLRARVAGLAYMSESYDRSGDAHDHVLNATFLIEVSADGSDAAPAPQLPADHVAAIAWVPVAAIAERIVVGVVREPLLAYLRGDLPRRYAGFEEAGVTIRWPSDSP
jgi:ADP-ribose pyrophosphatase YjhB (NUDIX family)